ncbi:restriction endonuclease subunit S [Acinetobacter bereziniae]|uniref:restriction endonuclease subunit S n=1 Tax=Acinetobacter bereziniae TaxID=106648 RepID=UPI00124E5DAF|nr:restriction endonuclease subunit S [Acinetobacter bereziniae]
MTAPKLRFKEFDGDWNTSKIDEIASVTSGGTPSRGNPEYWDGDIPWVTTSLVDFNVIHSAEEFITKEGVNNSSAKLFPKDTILMAMYGQGITRGKVAILGIEATTNQACCAIKLKDCFDTQFIFQNLMNRYDEIRDLSNDGGQKNLSAGIIKDISINIPSKAEQTKIASFLSAVDEKISQLTQKHELLSQYKQGMMQKLFSQQIRFKADDGSEFGGWEKKELKTISQIYDGTHQTPNYVEEGVPFYSVEHVTANNFTKTKFIAEDVYLAELKRVKLEKGDILLTRIGDIGTSRLIDWEVRASFYVSLALIKVKEKHSSSFVNQYIKSPFFQRELHERTIHVAFPKKINLGEIGLCVIKVPCLKEQIKIANFLSAIDQKIEVVAKQIEQAKTWKKGLLQQMFV